MNKRNRLIERLQSEAGAAEDAVEFVLELRESLYQLMVQIKVSDAPDTVRSHEAAIWALGYVHGLQWVIRQIERR